MNIVLTGAAGNVSQPLAQTLLAQGHAVTVIGRNPDNLKPLADQGATLTIGNIEDGAFLTEAFRGADAVYTMIPAPYQAPDWVAYGALVGGNYTSAIRANRVKKVVNLSTYGAHRSEGIGPVASLAKVEHALETLTNTSVMYVVSQKWTDRGEKRRETFKHFARSEKYDFSAFSAATIAWFFSALLTIAAGDRSKHRLA